MTGDIGVVRVKNPIFIKKKKGHSLLKEETLQLVVLNASGKLYSWLGGGKRRGVEAGRGDSAAILVHYREMLSRVTSILDIATAWKQVNWRQTWMQQT